MKFLRNNVILPVATVLAIIAVWAVASAVLMDELVLPSPAAVAAETAALLGKGDFYVDVARTFGRAVVTFLLSEALALLFALLSQIRHNVGLILQPIVTILRSVPTMSVILIALVAMKSGQVPLFVSFLVVFPVAYSAFALQLGQLGNLEQMCKVFSVGKLDAVRYLYLPSLKGQLVEQVRASLPLSLKVVIAGEAVSLPSVGMGREMWFAQNNLLTARLLAWTVAAIALCFLVELAVWATMRVVRGRRKK